MLVSAARFGITDRMVGVGVSRAAGVVKDAMSLG